VLERLALDSLDSFAGQYPIARSIIS
jgi:hypothetical protein